MKKASYSTVGVDFLNFVADKFFLRFEPSASHAHARCVNKFFRVMVDLPAAASSIFMDVKRAALHASN